MAGGEAYRPEVGWSLNGVESKLDDQEQAKILYQRLETTHIFWVNKSE